MHLGDATLGAGTRSGVELMPNRRGQVASRCAFTLLELLVVISIITILLSLLLPSLREFREHARTVACQSHMGAIGKSLINYALDLDSFPITSDYTGKPVSWRYGGWSGSNPGLWKTVAGGTYYVRTRDRPLSVYMYRGAELSDDAPLPAFRCPSDRRSNGVGPIGIGAGDMPAFENYGTSYHLNWHWFDDQTELPCVPAAQNRKIERVRRGQRIWWKYMQQNVSRFVTLLEDPAQRALTNREQIEGNHRKYSKHNFAFLDGHAEYLYADTQYLHQRDWTVVDETPPYKDWRVD